MAHNNTSTCLIIGAIIMIIIFVCLKNGSKESYANVGEKSVNEDFHPNLVDASSHSQTNTVSHDYFPAQEESPVNFASFVNNGSRESYDDVGPPALNAPEAERLTLPQGNELMPRISKDVTPWNIDIADPITHSFQVASTPVQLKDPGAMLADPYRGDIPIRYNANTCLVTNSRYGRDSQRLDGFFSDAGAALYAKYTGLGYKNMPMAVVNEELIMDA